MLVVGLTGGIGTGKFTVSKDLRKNHKLSIIDADLIARQVVEPGRRAYRQIIETFGDEVEGLTNADGSLNRAALGKAVFGNKLNLKKLNSIVHPEVRREIIWQLVKAYMKVKDLVILDVPLLFESGLNRICGATVTVSCLRDLQVERLKLRNPELSTDDIHKRIDSQMSNEERNFRSDLIIDNSGTMDDLRATVSAVIKELRPSILCTLLDLFPPFGILSALYTFIIRTIRDRYKGTGPSKKNA